MTFSKQFCTLSDANFLVYGLAMYKSLMKYNDKFILHYLCTDMECFDKLEAYCKNNNICNIIIYSLASLEIQFPELQQAKNLEPSFEARNVANRVRKNPKEIQYFWCLSSWFTWYCVEELDVYDILYIDSDIYFYDNWKKVFDEIGDASIGIVRHRILPAPNPMVGEYNVGIVYFKNDLHGWNCSTFWKNCLIGYDNVYRKTHGMCGDQKYLELFPKLFQNVKIIDEKVGHFAPWNVTHQEIFPDHIMWEGRKQDLIYGHFSNFKPDYEKDEYDPAPRHGLTKGTWTSVPLASLYDEYYNVCKKVYEELK